MYELNKIAFGSFLAQLRREKGMTQKELAACLYVSDKAVSKWERGLSVPDISLLVPLAEQAGVHLTRLSDYAVMQNDESRVVLLGFSGMDEEQIRQGLSALQKAWG